MYRGCGIDPIKLGYFSLLHDIGKPLQRFRLRSGSYNDLSGPLDAELISRLSKHARSEDHESLGYEVLNWLLGLSKEDVKEYRSMISIADRSAASERSPIYEYGKPEEIMSIYKSVIREIYQEGVQFDPSTSPLLAPTWILDYTNYSKLVDWCSESPGEGLVESFVQNIAYKAMVEGDMDSLRKVIHSVVSSMRWLPVVPIDYSFIKQGYEMTLPSQNRITEAVRKNNYKNVVQVLLRYLTNFKKLYGGHLLNFGALYSLDRIMSLSLLFVPSAVYGSIVPDIGLYSHSRIVAGISEALNAGDCSSFRLLVTDLNGIQRFIYSPRVEAAASRVLRGRSIIVELVSHIIVDTVLDAVKMPGLNYIVKEGGTSTLILPNYENIETDIKELWKSVLSKLYDEFQGKLKITMTLSSPINAELLAYNKEKAVDVYSRVMSELGERLQENKSLVNSILSLEGKTFSPRTVEAFDTLTGEPVYEDDPYKITFTDSTSTYLNTIAPEKLSDGDIINGLTHKSIVAGSLSRNLKYIVLIEGENSVQLGKALIDRFSEHKIPQAIYSDVLIPSQEGGSWKIRVGMIPFENLESTAILVSSTEELENDASYKIQIAIWFILDNLIHILDSTPNIIPEKIKRIRVYTVGIPSLDLLTQLNSTKNLVRIIRELVDKHNIQFELDYMLIPTKHPSGEKGLLGLDDIAKRSIPEGMIALSKIDGDKVGEIIHLYSSLGPSRLAMFSDTMNLAFQVLPLILQTDKEENVAHLYGGGDDIVIYGGLMGVLERIKALVDSVKGLLDPLSFTASLSFDKSKTPVLYLYDRARKLLDEAKSIGGNILGLELAINPPSYPIECSDESDEKVKWIPGVPIKSNKINPDLDEVVKAVNTALRLSIQNTLLYTISNIGYRIIQAQTGKPPQQGTSNLVVESILRYSYLWDRHEDVVTKHQNILGSHIIPDPPWKTHEKTKKIVTQLARAKPVIDLILLTSRSTS